MESVKTRFVTEKQNGATVTYTYVLIEPLQYVHTTLQLSVAHAQNVTSLFCNYLTKMSKLGALLL